MPIFEYKGYDSKGQSAKGLREADTVKALRVILRRDGILATDIREASQPGFAPKDPNKSFLSREFRFKALTGRISIDAIGLATRQLGTLLSAGVTMVEALNALIDQTENANLKRVLSEVKSDVNEGLSLADAMQKHKAFSSIYINMVRAGESSGALEVVLERLADFTEGQAQLKRKVIGALVYPAVMACVGGVVLLVMVTTVVPKIAKIFVHSKVTLPFMTRVLIWTSDIVLSFWWLLILLFALAVFGFLRWKKTPNGRARWDRLRLRMPIFGKINQMVAIARFSRTLSTLLASGVPLLTSLQIVRNVVANDAIEKAVDAVRDAVREGEDIATPLRKSGQFPPMVTHMIAIGEKSGQLENMLTRVATTYEQQVQVQVGTLTSILEPLMIVVMGGSVGFIVFAILTPILQMSQLVK